MGYKITFASLTDVAGFMRFMHDVWRSDHILSKHRDLLLYDFQEGERLNIAIAKDDNDRIVGAFGFMKYSQSEIPDLSGSIWKVSSDIKEPMLGLKLREYVIKNIPHRYFAAPGTNVETKPIYEVLNMNWHRLDHYYILNRNLNSYKIATVSDSVNTSMHDDFLNKWDISVKLAGSASELKVFPFEKYSNIAPYKDYSYLKKRFFEHPIYKYDVYLVSENDVPLNIVVCRTASHLDASVYRMVDYYGPESTLIRIVPHIYNKSVDCRYEYLDFVCSGFNERIIFESGFSKLNIEEEDVIIPNYFEPFLKQNKPIYAVSDKSKSLQFRMCKADGDQDRPNII
ncbi:MAG: hypothetical protein ABW162_00535 [Candidatus Sedimenticola sp. PURPLELP]